MPYVTLRYERGKLYEEVWAEAVTTAAYILNRIPSKSIGNSTPDEKYYNRKPLVSHLRVFGCRCYVHIPKETRQKLDDKSRKCVFIGYSSEKKGYKCWDPTSRKVVLSRDVIFSERESYYKEQGSSKDDERATVEKPVEIEGEGETSKEEQLIEPMLRRSSRIRKPVDRLQYDSLCIEQHQAFMSNACLESEPKEYEEAMLREGWRIAMKEEMEAVRMPRCGIARPSSAAGQALRSMLGPTAMPTSGRRVRPSAGRQFGDAAPRFLGDSPRSRAQAKTDRSWRDGSSGVVRFGQFEVLRHERYR
jgi:hypothetical protein